MWVNCSNWDPIFNTRTLCWSTAYTDFILIESSWVEGQGGQRAMELHLWLTGKRVIVGPVQKGLKCIHILWWCVTSVVTVFLNFKGYRINYMVIKIPRKRWRDESIVMKITIKVPVMSINQSLIYLCFKTCTVMQDLKKCILIVVLAQINVKEPWSTYRMWFQETQLCVRVFAPVFYEQ